MDLNQVRATETTLLINRYDNIKNRFNATSTEEIIALQDNISALIPMIVASANAVTNLTNDIEENINKDRIQLLQLRRNLKNGFDDPQELWSAMQPFEMLRDNIQDSLNEATRGLPIINRNSYTVDNDLYTFANMLDRLEQELGLTEKSDYVLQHSSPLKRLMKRLLETYESLNIDANTSMQNLNNIQEKVNTALEKSETDETLPKSELKDSEKQHDALNRDLNINIKKLFEVKRAITHIAPELLEVSKYLQDNYSFADVVNTFEWINKTLHNANISLHDIEHTLLHIQQTATHVDKIPSIFLEEILKLEDIKNCSSATNNSIINIDNRISDLNDAIVNTNESLQILNDSMSTLLTKFVNVSNSTLHSKLYQLKDELLNLVKDADLIYIKQEGVLYWTKEIKSEFGYLADVVANKSSTIYDLQTRVKIASHVEKDLNDDIPKLQTQIANISNETHSLHHQLQKLVNITRDLIANFSKQEKIEYYELHFSKLDTRGVVSSLNQLINMTDGLQQSLVVANDSLNALTEQLEKHLNLHIDTSLIESGLSMSSIILKENSKQITDLLNEHIYLERFSLAPDGTYVSDNETIADMKLRYSTLKSWIENASSAIEIMWNSSHRTNHLIKENMQTIHLLTMQANLRKELENKLVYVQNQFRSVGNLTNITSHSQATAREYIDEFNSTLGIILETYRDLKLKTFNKEMKENLDIINEYNNTLIDILTDMTSIKLNITNIGENIFEIDDIFTEIITTLDNLTRINKNEKQKINILSNNIKFIEMHVEVNTNKTLSLLENLETYKKRVHDLNERFRRQQIYEYIKENFPQVLNAYENLNESMYLLKMNLSPLDIDFQQLFSVMDIVQKKADVYSTLNLDIDTINSYANEHQSNFKKTVKRVDDLMKNVHEMEEKLSNSTYMNETIGDVKTRFSAYETTIKTIAEDIAYVNKSLKPIQIFVNATHQDMSEINTLIDRYVYLNDTFDILKNNIKQIKAQDDNSTSMLMNLSIGNALLRDAVEQLGSNFSHINDSSLQERLQNVEDTVIKSLFSIVNTTNDYTKQHKLFEEINTAVSILEELFGKVINDKHSFQNIVIKTDEYIQNASKLLDTFREYVANILENKVNQHIDDLAFITNEKNILMYELLEQEKIEYVKRHRPLIGKRISETMQNVIETSLLLEQTTSFSEDTNMYMLEVESAMNGTGNIRIPLSDNNDLYTRNSEYLAQAEESLQLIKETIQLSNVSEVVVRTNWTSFKMNQIEEHVQNVTNNLTLASTSIAAMNSSLSDISNNINNASNYLLRLEELIIGFKTHLNTSKQTEKNLIQLKTKLNYTDDLLTKVFDKLKRNKQIFSNLTTRFSGVTNKEIEQYKTEINDIIEDIVSVRIPRDNSLFTNRVLKKYNIVSNQFDDVKYILNNTYSSMDELQIAMQTVDDQLMNVTLETERMFESENFYNNDSTILLGQLKQSGRFASTFGSTMQYPKET
ncbi:hypothetical protein DPMN_134114 [Dreissena polymorpha]|uniref:Uncharacterized protein n=1 Tax=Dreissena polymorpha TaxID=45954 RepID=A0A9D4JBM5_DREPO|nr:hypothetical protein DPMN_134114 [Dreissena polymorpha]